MTYKLYWGDLHSHCSISYGHGTVGQALARARQQLDFCSITGHAFWPDMPADRAVYAEIIDYHHEGFARLARNWEELLAAQGGATEPGSFIAFPSYEWHSLEFGDHNVYAPGPDLPLLSAPDLPGLRTVVGENGGIAVPHHIGYKAGYRGIDWRHFQEDGSPFVEVFSLHGCSIRDDAPYPMLHDMGPRDYGSTAEAGWSQGHRFGVVGGTDHHAAYPGSHGDGRMGVFATELTREALWEAFLARRVFAATGDRIHPGIFVDGAWMGSTIQSPGSRQIDVLVRGADALDKVSVFKNGRLLRQGGPMAGDLGTGEAYRLRLTWGWGRKSEAVRWQGALALSAGRISAVESCFSGEAVVSPKGDDETSELENDALPHEVVETADRSCAWRSITTGNLTMRHATTQALSVALEAPLDADLTVEVNGCRFVHRLGGLLHAGRSHFLRGWLSEAVRIGPLVPFEECTVQERFTDEPEKERDVYRVEVAQKNGQWAWSTPIWVER